MSLITEPTFDALHTDGDSLRIGVVAPPWYCIPPKAYGGTEAVVAAVVDQLVARGHHVTLVASGEPGTAAQRYVQVYEEPPYELLGHDVMPELVNAAEAHAALSDLDLDVIHDNSAAGPLSAPARKCPTVVTTHGPVAGPNGDYYRRLGATVELVAISEAQRRQAPDLHWAGMVHNAVDVASFPFNPDKSDYLLWMGRFCPDKAPDLAIEVARRSGRPIVLAGKLNDQREREYFESRVRPLLGPDTDYVGEADSLLKRELYANAAALVFPIQWEEPFGMVMAEALACGTPVVATPRGSVPEIVRPGHNGFIARDVEGLVDAVARLDEIRPADCRADALARFDLPVMASGYERVFRRVIGEGGTVAKRLTTAA
ncbi:glycosyltransferase family 4 protein [Tessaracoccus oleiagri]|uniref:Glycosyltransferase involved in cell wall bisynthesis n=1 Tax=Tessaracoccus oleiagri TaxID=686624 RepID=A0A1G9MH33_9ACTN|nr:glycosyltransferase family 4 protein [Tessaracoccus oleiagri]SDL72975.1 Glycosyltransferase involved in cell wall bisynthesis [Tessaracoccus oleiagri]